MRVLTTLIPLALATCGFAQKDVPPPGLVKIEGGTTLIGSDWKALEPLVHLDSKLMSSLAAETPEHRVEVPDFYLMVTEVTHEQYAAYVRAVEAKPPLLWADKDELEAVQREDIEKQQQARNQARAAGQPVPELLKFEPEAWWQQNWKEATWSVPVELSSRPITNVNYQEASGYARWAGLRLMTEYEFQRAVRGKDDRLYPWGEEFRSDALAFNENSNTEPWPVASFPAGASEEGVYDLVGNVWEWTSSPFVQFDGWKLKTLKVKEGKRQREIDGKVEWDANERVLVGGNYQNGKVPARCTTRRGTGRYQSTDGHGFRCAASIEPGRDMSKTVLDADLPVEKRPAGVTYLTELATAADRWLTEPGSAQLVVEVEEQGETKKKSIDLPNYAVITGYDYVMFVPSTEPDAGSTVKGMRTKSLEEGIVHLGFFATTMPSLVPELPAGTYQLAFRGGGEDAIPGPEEKADGEVVEAPVPLEYPEGTDLSVDNLLVLDTDGKPVAALADFKLDYAKDKPGTVTLRDGTRPIVSVDEKGKQTTVEEPVDEAFFQVAIPASGNRRAWHLDFAIQFAKGTFDDSWRAR